MKTIRALLFVISAVALPSEVFSLWPLPQELSTGSKALRLSPNFKITASFKNIPSDLSAAIEQTETYLQTDGLAPLVVDRGQSEYSTIKDATEIQGLTLTLPSQASVQSISSEAVQGLQDRDDSYSLNIPSSGASAEIKANTTLGLYRGLTTFSQLWYTVNGIIYTSEAPIAISDVPAFVSRIWLRTICTFVSEC